MMNKNNYCVIMAGGVGSRFWPLSKTNKPKQFLDILGLGKSFIRMTFERFAQICPIENIFVVTNELYTDLVKQEIPEIADFQILAEPLRKNTAPCIAYSNMIIKKINPDARIITAPSDHLILNESKFISVIKRGLEFINENDGLLTIGIKPSRPETGYGYIQIQNESANESFAEIQKVQTFTEKPDLEIAKQFVQSGEFFWNSGIFIWTLKSINKSFEIHQPDIYTLFDHNTNFNTKEEEHLFIKAAFSECKNISVDKGIMEHASNVFVYCSEFGWSDVGTWDSLYENSQKNESGDVILGKNVLTYDTKNCLVNVPNNKLVVLQGLENYLIAESDNILLICQRNDEQKIRQFVNDIKIQKGESYI